MSSSAGHINTCVGVASFLREFGHEVHFGIVKQWTKEVDKYNFPIHEYVDPEVKNVSDPQAIWGQWMRDNCHNYQLPPIEQHKKFFRDAYEAFHRFTKSVHPAFEEIIKKVNPDLILIDFYVPVPAVIKSGIPWCLAWSCNPVLAYQLAYDGPPAFSGLSPKDDPKLYHEFVESGKDFIKEIKANYDEWLKTLDVQPNPDSIIETSPYLNLLFYPKDVDYAEIGPVPDKWHRLDHALRPHLDESLDIVDSFLGQNDKLVFFSLGSMGSADVELMKKLVSWLAKSKHKFIVSKGPFHEEIDLADHNMIGGKYLNQLAILKRADLVITHGGNNTFVETLYFGKPMIVLPLFGDQHDNATRVKDLGIGRSFNPYKVTEEELLGAIDDILSDRELSERMRKIGENVRSTDSYKQLNEKLLRIKEAKMKE